MNSPLIQAAAAGDLPGWAEAGRKRRAHMARVAELLGEWADAMKLPAADRQEWVAVGWLHDSLRDAEPSTLRGALPEPFRRLPDAMLHGPAAADRLHGLISPAAESAIRFHTIGDPSLDRLGCALYLADFLEPGRKFRRAWTARLRARVPHAFDEVLVEVVAARLGYALAERRPIHRSTAAFWTRLVLEAG